MQKINQIDIAKSQLETAIRLYIDRKDYISSATLAGAAEEIFGKLLEDNNQTNSLNQDADQILDLLFEEEKNVLSSENNYRKTIINIINFQKNWLKHRDKDNFELYFSPESEASEMLNRAIRNYIFLFKEKTSSINDFLDCQEK